MLTLVELLPDRMARFSCECGGEKITRKRDVEAGKVRSCGCIVFLGNHRTHGRSRIADRTYSTWNAMMNRCYNPSADKYHYYGARGITVWEEWHDFRVFLFSMGERPEGRTLDRINNDLGYNPINCRWATPTEQRANQRRCLSFIQSPPG